MDAEDVARKLQPRLTLALSCDTTVSLRQCFLSSNTGGALWDSSVVLCDVLQQFGCRGRVLELGSGIGACALQAAALGASLVVATDGDAAVLDVLRRNCATYDTIVVRELKWGDDDVPVGETFDLLLGSDLIYDAEQHDALLRTIARISAARLLLSVRKRDPKAEQRFVRRLLNEQPWRLERVIRARDLAPASLFPPVNRTGCAVYAFIKRGP